MFTFRGPHIVMMGGGLDFYFRILLLTKYQAHVQVQTESYKLLLLSLSLSEEAIEKKFSIRMLLKGRRRRFIRQTNRKQTKTIQTMIHTGRTINKTRFDFPLPEVIAVDDMLTGRVVTLMREYFIETFKRVVAEEIMAEEIVGGQSIRIFTRVVERHFIGLSLRSNQAIFGNGIRSSVMFTTVKLLWAKSESFTHSITL